MRTYKEFIELVNEAWHPPFKALASGKTPMQKAREKSKTNSKIDLEKVRTSPKRYADDLNDPGHPDYEYKKTDNGAEIRSRRHPIKVSFTKTSDGGHVINTTTTGKPENPAGAARAAHTMKSLMANAGRPGAVLHSVPTGNAREARGRLNKKLGMSDVDDRGLQSGRVAHRSPKQRAKGMSPMNPHKHEGHFIDPNH